MTASKSDADGEEEKFEAENIDQDKLPFDTKLYGTASNSKRVALSKWVHEVIRYGASERNRKMTQGVMSYEALLFHYEELSDDIDSMEVAVDTLLSGAGVDTQAIDNVRVMSHEDAREEMMKEVDEPEKKRNQVKIWLPESIVQSAPWTRGWNNKIEEALVTVYASAYSDRFDRVECKQQVFEYVTEGAEPSHEVARAICLGVGVDNYLNVPSIDQSDSVEVSFDTGSEVDQDDTDSEDDLFDYDDLTPDVLRDEGDEYTLKDDKFQLLNTVYSNGHITTRDEAAELINDAWGEYQNDYEYDVADEWIDQHNIVLSDVGGLSDAEEQERVNAIAQSVDGDLRFPVFRKFDIEHEQVLSRLLSLTCKRYWEMDVFDEPTLTDIELAMEYAGFDTPARYDDITEYVANELYYVREVNGDGSLVPKAAVDA